MHAATATCQTTNASRYLAQICKHFAHKVPVTSDESEGHCVFPCGAADLAADKDALRIRVASVDPDGLTQTKHVIESHLLRFAFREKLPPLAWTE